MIETLTQNVDQLNAILTVIAVPSFIMVVTSLLKNKLSTYTPYIAVTIGIAIGLTVSLTFFGLDVMTVLIGIIFGSITGASAVGIKVIADGEKPKLPTYKVTE